MSIIRRSSRLGLAAIVVLSLTAVVAPAVSAGGSSGTTTRWVDNDGHAGPNGCGGNATAFKKIQKAVDHSNDNDLVLVCPGTYRGTVVITGDRDGLTLRGTDPWSAVLVPPLMDPAAGISEVDMVTIQQVSNVTVRGLKVSAADEPNCSYVGVGILVLGAQDATVRGNQVYASRSSADCGYANGILISDLEPSPPAPRPAGIDTIGASALIAHNLVSNFDNWGIAVGEESNVTAQVTDNSIHYYKTNGPVTAASARARHSFWASRTSPAGSFTPAGGFEQAGIFLLGGANALVNLNVVQSSPDVVAQPTALRPSGEQQPAVLQDGIQAFEEDGDVVIRDNLIRRVFVGMFIQAIEFTVDDNTVRVTEAALDTGYGGGGNRFRDNSFSGFEVGIYVDSSTSGNIFRRNTANSSEGTACMDTTTGSGTAGTNNHWVGNTGNSSNPPAICPPA